MTDEECRELGIMTEKELDEMFDRFHKMEEIGISDTMKYFDRIHDKVFSLNSLLIAAYFALIAIRKDVPAWSLIIPTFNSGILLYIDYQMLTRSRIQATITSVDAKTRDKYGSITRLANFYSLVAIFSTLTVVLLFGYFLFSK